jgi:enamine deaminase RidA (YjgF/YER057c/UK114 family)
LRSAGVVTSAAAIMVAVWLRAASASAGTTAPIGVSANSSPDSPFPHSLIRLTGAAGPGTLSRMTVRLVWTDRLYGGVPYAYASAAPPGALVFTAGACPLDEKGEVTGAGDVRVQAARVMRNLSEALAAAGAKLTDVLKTTIYVASSDRSDLVAVWEVVRAAFAGHDAPSTLLGVTALGYPGQLVEVEAVAALGDGLAEPR